MPNLNMPDSEGGGRPIQPMMAGRDGGGVAKKIVIVLVILILGGGGYYLYKSGKLPFLTKKAEPAPPPAVVVPPPDTSALAATSPTTTTTLPPAAKADKKTDMKADKKTVAIPDSKPAPKQEMGKGDFTIFIASFQSKKSAEDEAARWSNAGFQSMVNEKGTQGGMRYRVSLGRYETRQEAMKAAKEMEHMFETGFWVDKVQ